MRNLFFPWSSIPCDFLRSLLDFSSSPYTFLSTVRTLLHCPDSPVFLKVCFVSQNFLRSSDSFYFPLLSSVSQILLRSSNFPSVLKISSSPLNYWRTCCSGESLLNELVHKIVFVLLVFSELMWDFLCLLGRLLVWVVAVVVGVVVGGRAGGGQFVQ